MEQLQKDLLQLIKKHKKTILSMGYIGKQKGMTILIKVLIDKTEDREKYFSLVGVFEGKGWNKKGKAKTETFEI